MLLREAFNKKKTEKSDIVQKGVGPQNHISGRNEIVTQL